MNIKSKILRYSVGPLGAALISLATIPLIAWLYTIEDVAKFSIFQSVIVLYTLVLSFGLDQAFIREYYESKNKDILLKNILSGVLIPSLIFLLLALIFFRESMILFLFDEYSIQIFLLTIFSCLFSLFIKILSLIQRLKEQALLFSLSQLLPKIIFLILIFVFFMIGSTSFHTILLAQFLSVLVVLLYFFAINFNAILSSLKCRINFSSIRGYYIFGVPLIFSGALIWGMKLADRFYLKILSDLDQLGQYAMAISIASGVAIFSGIFNTIWSPLVYKWVEESNVDKKLVADKIKKISEVISLCILGIIIFLVLTSKYIVNVLPSVYSEIYLIIPLCALTPLLYTLSEVTGIGINLMKKTQLTFWSCVFAVIFHLILCFLLIPYLGSRGAAIAGALSFYIFFIVKTIFSNYFWFNCELKRTYAISFLSLCFSLLPVLI